MFRGVGAFALLRPQTADQLARIPTCPNAESPVSHPDPVVHQTVLVVDDDEEVRATVANTLTSRGFRVYEARNGNEAREQLASRDVEIVVLDLGLPDISGLDVLHHIRDVSALPVIILSGHGEEIDRVVGLEMGADDYVVKPFSARELEARIHSVLRRAGQRRDHRRILDFGELLVDTGAREVRFRGCLVPLTPKEYQLLAHLVERPRICCSRGDLLREVWASDAQWQDEATVTEHVRRIRNKLGLAPDEQSWISTVRGVGYRFDPA